jgi:hypothetical protein
MDHPCLACPVSTVLREMAGMAFREVLVTQVKEVLRAWLAGLGKRPAAARGRVNVKTAARYIAAAQEAGLSRDGGEGQLTDELLGMVVAAVRPARPAGRGESWQLLETRKEEITRWVGDDLTLVKIGEKLERSGTVVPYRTLARFAAEECGYSSGGRKVTVPVDDGEPGQELQADFGYLGMIPDGDRQRKLHARSGGPMTGPGSGPGCASTAPRGSSRPWCSRRRSSRCCCPPRQGRTGSRTGPT